MNILDLFLGAMILGIVMAMCYDILRFVRYVFDKLPHWAIAIMDLSWFTLYAFMIFTYSMINGGGTIRFYFVFAAFLATLCYLNSVGRITKMLFKHIARVLSAIIGFIFVPIRKILIIISHKLGFIFRHIYRFFIKIIKNIQKSLLKGVKILYNNIVRRKAAKIDVNIQENLYKEGSERRNVIKARVTRSESFTKRL